MTLPAKVLWVIAATIALLAVVIIGAFWWARTVPSRPNGVAADAVFLWAPNVGLPAPRRGWWISCEEDADRNRCTLSDINGKTEYEGEFLSSDGGGPLPSNQLKIDANKTQNNKVWVGRALGALVPLVYLENGKVLIPASKFEEGMRLLKQMRQ